MDAVECPLATVSDWCWWQHQTRRSTRVIPALLLSGSGFVKTRKFKNPVYLGDPINIVKIFNEKEVDEIVVLDIDAGKDRREPNFALLADIASECFMPLTYGGGITSQSEISRLINLGFEKICLNTHAVTDPDFVREASANFGSSTIVVSLDVYRNMFGRELVYVRGGREKTNLSAIQAAELAETSGAGELFINSINRDGAMVGYDLDLIRNVADAVNIPVVACGGAATSAHLAEAALESGASAVAAGSMFVFHGPHRAVLINVPSNEDLSQAGLP